jgi:HD-like signal output (HDOD) protein
VSAESNSFVSKTCESCHRVYTSEADFFANTCRWRICDQKNLWFNCSCGSTLIIKKGKFDWYNPGKTMSQAAAGVFNQLAGLQELPHVPTAVMEIQESLQAPDVDIPMLAKKVRNDPLLAAGLLETANNIKSSRDPGDRKKIDSIEHAIMYIGKAAFSDLVMTISLKSFVTSTKLFNADRFWKESFITADLAEFIAAKWGATANRDEVYICAALCNIGKIVGAMTLPASIDKIEAMVNNPKTLCHWTQAEALLKTPSHTILGEIGGALWGLPKYVLEAISSHHGQVMTRLDKGKKRTEPKLSMRECVALANQLSHWILLRPSRMDQSLFNQLTQAANISAKEIEAFAETHAGLAGRAA